MADERSAQGNGPHFNAPLVKRHALAPVVIPNFMTSEECSALIGHFGSRPMTSGQLAGHKAAGHIRSASTLWFDDAELPWLGLRLVKTLSTLAAKDFPYDFIGFDEGYQLLRYENAPNVDQQAVYSWHSDMGMSGLTQSRKLTFIIQLSMEDDYEGAVLQVNYGGFDISLPADQGTLLVFPSFVLHQVSPLLSGLRYALAAWAHGPAFR